MPQLKKTKVYRAGVTAQTLNFETSSCSASVNQRDESLDVRFEIASKGGGTTQICLEIGKDDFETILREIAAKLPESVGILTDCASIANKKNLELLENARKLQSDEKSRIHTLIGDLEPVEAFVTQKYYDAPAGEDVKEEELKNKVQQVMSSLRQLR